MKRLAHNRLPDDLVQRMYADYSTGMRTIDLEAKYNRCFASIWNVFQAMAKWIAELLKRS